MLLLAVLCRKFLLKKVMAAALFKDAYFVFLPVDAAFLDLSLDSLADIEKYGFP